MNVVGVICEYDPFHNGHLAQFRKIRSLLPDAHILCLMSGCFTQRGMPALHQPSERAKTALACGAEMVLELPCLYAVQDAEHFAFGAVQILQSLGFVTHVSFGAEDELSLLQSAAEVLEEAPPAFSHALKAGLEKGLSYAAAQGEALQTLLQAESPFWEKPNNILGICYLRSLLQLRSRILPLAVSREGDYHGQVLNQNAFPSATAVRQAFLSGDFASADAACPLPLPRSPICLPDALDKVLLYALRRESAEELRNLPDCTEGLENRLKAAAARASTREELLALLKTRRYAYTRLSRLCCHALLESSLSLREEHPQPEYVRVLGLRKGTVLSGMLKHSDIPVLAKAADGPIDNAAYQLDLRAYDLWALGAGLQQGLLFRQSVIQYEPDSDKEAFS